MLEKVLSLINDIWCLVDKGDLITGVIIPILVTFLAYNLVEMSNKKKESNRLNIELFWIEKEITANTSSLSSYVKLNNDCCNLRDSMRYILDKDFPIKVMTLIKKLKESYPTFDNRFLFGELSEEQALMLQRIKKIEEELAEKKSILEKSSVDNTNLKSIISALEVQQQNLILNYKKEFNYSLHDKLKFISSVIKNEYIALPSHAPEEMSTQAVLNIIQNIFEDYDKLPHPNQDNVLKVFEELLLCREDIGIFKPSSDFDDFEKEFEFSLISNLSPQDKILYEFYQKYADWELMRSKIDSYVFPSLCEKWSAYQNDLVLINKGDFYLELCEYYQKISKYKEDISKDIASEIITESNLLLKKISKVKKKLQKKC